MRLKTTLCAIAFIVAGASSTLAAVACPKPAFTKDQILAAQNAWAEGIVAIGKAEEPFESYRREVKDLMIG